VNFEFNENAVTPKVASRWSDKKTVLATNKVPAVIATTTAVRRCPTRPKADTKTRLSTTVKPFAPGLTSIAIAASVAITIEATVSQANLTEKRTPQAKSTETARLLKPDAKRSVPPKRSNENPAKSELDCHL
jgi:negative regulator of sigma E activity